MAIIYIRKVPEDVVEVYRRRAEAAGQSLRAYLREQLIGGALRGDKAEVMAHMRETLACDPGPGLSAETIEESLRELRGE